MSDLRDIVPGVTANAIGNKCYTKNGLTAGTTTATLKTTATAVFSINGQQYSLASADNQAVTLNSADPQHTLQGSGAPSNTQAVGCTTWYAVGINAAGALFISKGPDVLTSADATTPANARLNDVPSSQCCIGAIKVVTDATHTFTPGTTGFAATGITSTFFDLSNIGTGTPS